MFKYKKTVQALNFFARKAKEDGKKLYKTNALKLLFFADKKHLRDYLRTITGDRYTAMQMGPVAMNAKELIETQQKGEETEAEDIQYANEYIASTSPAWIWNQKSGIEITSKKEVNERSLSETDREILNFIWNTYKKYLQPGKEELWEKTHDYPEGRKFEENNNTWTEIKEEELFSSIPNDPLGEDDTDDAKELYQEKEEARKAFGMEKI